MKEIVVDKENTIIEIATLEDVKIMVGARFCIIRIYAPKEKEDSAKLNQVEEFEKQQD